MARTSTRRVRWWFLRGLGVVSWLAFRSLRAQLVGLYGERGITPIRDRLARVRDAYGRERFRRVPTVFWLGRRTGPSDQALVAVCRAGEAASLLLTANFAPQLSAFSAG